MIPAFKSFAMSASFAEASSILASEPSFAPKYSLILGSVPEGRTHAHEPSAVTKYRTSESRYIQNKPIKKNPPEGFLDAETARRLEEIRMGGGIRTILSF